MITLDERDASPERQADIAGRRMANNLRVAMPGIVTSFNSKEQTVSVRCAVRERLTQDGTDSWVEIPVLVYYTEFAGSLGRRDSLFGVRGAGPQLDPDEPPFVEVDKAIRMDIGCEVCLIPDEHDRIELEICELDPPCGLE